MRKYIFCILLSGTFISCSFMKKERLILSTHYFMNQDGVDSVEVDMRKILGIDYDSLYIFSEYCRSNIEDILGIQYTTRREIPDSYQRAIFLSGDQIICEFDLCADRIYFSEYTERNDINDGSCSVYYGSKFIVKKINGPYYQTFIYAKKKEKEIPLYDRRYMGNGLFEIVEIQ